MADDDNFDIDIYGDDVPEFVQEPADQVTEDTQHNDSTFQSEPDGTDFSQPPNEAETEPRVDLQEDEVDYTAADNAHASAGTRDPKAPDQSQEQQQQIASTTGVTGPQLAVPKQAPRQQGAQREEGAEDTREIDAGATSALRLAELQWWITEDDIRGWANQCEVENEVKDLTFNEHKVNGKSKGEVFIELQTAQGATALKRHIDTFGAGQQYVKKHTVIYVRPDFNPFKTYPKDAPARAKEGFKERQQGAYNTNYNNNNNNGGGGFRGGRGGFNNRGSMNSTGNAGMGNFSQGRGGFTNPQMGMMGGYGGMNNMGGMGMNGMGGFGGQMNFNRGGGMMNMNRGGFTGGRGGRGNMMGNMNMMPNMGMGAMGAMGGMNMGGMGMTGYPQGQFNPQFFGGGNSPQNMSQGGNPHGAKRPRPE